MNNFKNSVKSTEVDKFQKQTNSLKLSVFLDKNWAKFENFSTSNGPRRITDMIMQSGSP
jgi:hypothetical protein